MSTPDVNANEVTSTMGTTAPSLSPAQMLGGSEPLHPEGDPTTDKLAAFTEAHRATTEWVRHISEDPWGPSIPDELATLLDLIPELLEDYRTAWALVELLQDHIEGVAKDKVESVLAGKIIVP